LEIADMSRAALPAPALSPRPVRKPARRAEAVTLATKIRALRVEELRLSMSLNALVDGIEQGIDSTRRDAVAMRSFVRSTRTGVADLRSELDRVRGEIREHSTHLEALILGEA